MYYIAVIDRTSDHALNKKLNPLMKHTKPSLAVLFLIVISLTESGFNFLENTTTDIVQERHEFVRKGNHSKEMSVADYVAIETTTSEGDAKIKSDQLKEVENVNVSYGYLTEKKLWYVYLKGPTDNLDDTRALCNKIRQQEKFKNVWLLTVHS
jgi:hypothetical protein